MSAKKPGFVTVACTWMLILMRGLDAGHVPKKHVAAPSCRLKELTALTKSLLLESLNGFDKANGHVGTWSPGFPELRDHHNSPLNGSEVQCCLLFMAQGLKEILDDQRNNLNPTDALLHETLNRAISKVKMLEQCAKDHLGGECTPKPTPPSIPRNASESEGKQWSHTLLKTARGYLDWLEQNFSVQMSKVKGKNNIKHKASEANLQKYLKGSRSIL